MSPVLNRLPVLVVSPYSRCNCRCVMCDIWKNTDQQFLSPENFRRQLASVASMDVQWVVFSGGEPLMHPRIFDLCEIAKDFGARVTLLSTGLLLGKHTQAVASHVDDVIVSLDGPEDIHDSIRRVHGAFRDLSSGVERLLELNPEYKIVGRCTVQRANCETLTETVAAARSMGLRSISFLAVDVSSTAFHRATELNVIEQHRLAIGIEQLPRFERQIEQIIEQEGERTFVVESPAKLRRLVHRFRSYWDGAALTAPVCNAPWTSAVVEANGSIRPCFFHPPIGQIAESNDLRSILNGQEAIDFRAGLDVSTNPICQRCVCSLNWKNS